MYHSLFTHSIVERDFGGFQFLDIMIKAAINIHTQVIVRTYIFFSLSARSFDKCMFNFIGNSQTVFQSGCEILHSSQQCKRVPVTAHSLKHLVLSSFICLFVCFLDILICGVSIHLGCYNKMPLNK